MRLRPESTRRASWRAAWLSAVARRAAAAEQARRWELALELSARAVRVEPLLEEGHRGIMRAWAGPGERLLALQHYERFAAWLRREHDEVPDVATARLAEALGARTLTVGGDGRAAPAAPTHFRSVIRPVAVPPPAPAAKRTV